MELVLTIFAGIGALLFIIGYLSYLFSGFRHHFVTGLISALPVLNIVTLPALWNKAGKRFLMGAFGLIIFATSWFFGADKTLITSFISGKQETDITNSKRVTSYAGAPLNLPSTSPKSVILEKNKSKPMPSASITRPFGDNRKLQNLPSNALYYLAFENIGIDKIATLKGRIVRIKMKDNTTAEGRLVVATDSSVVLQIKLVQQEFPIGNIKQLELMIKK